MPHMPKIFAMTFEEENLLVIIKKTRRNLDLFQPYKIIAILCKYVVINTYYVTWIHFMHCRNTIRDIHSISIQFQKSTIRENKGSEEKVFKTALVIIYFCHAICSRNIFWWLPHLCFKQVSNAC